ncbi:hypothetical protein KKF84_18400 [Myxococcota bacterium]|nr:hypothetical protein [Myxococcota bacterium]MBU1537295.1 hypothetical protein [Myxococcota bacterium]
MKLHSVTVSTRSYPLAGNLVLGTIMGASLLVSGCAGGQDKNEGTAPHKSDPVLPQKQPGVSTSTKPADPVEPKKKPAGDPADLVDTDKDGVPDKYDRCPTVVGNKVSDGCPRFRGVVVKPRPIIITKP